MATTTLKILREINDRTQEEIANVLGISQNTYSRLERNPKNLTSEQAQKLADFYNVNIADLLTEGTPSITFNDTKVENNAYVGSIENDNHISASAAENATLKDEIAYLRKQNEELLKMINTRLNG
ncbi:XRE family transcriptional regulator [Lacibacter luteus]|uniref:XRE family transcriptional regulator n=1 Tax=Lacibacter luteus TaxID=2508719 RepID=A0A4Q1CGB3_9BACT|nr:helix-turn-helix transcriptional regulator [Lacibacter luteus]RXK59180.1 XRE family transcriptional regulator [Lacibacter luteus]